MFIHHSIIHFVELIYHYIMCSVLNLNISPQSYSIGAFTILANQIYSDMVVFWLQV